MSMHARHCPHITALRFGLATLLLTTATGKLLDTSGFAAVVATYRVLLATVLLHLGLFVWSAVAVARGLDVQRLLGRVQRAGITSPGDA